MNDTANRWTDYLDATVWTLHQQGFSTAEIGVAINRTEVAVKYRLQHIRIARGANRKSYNERDPVELVVRELRDSGFSVREIARRLRRSPEDVEDLLARGKRGALA